MTKESEILTQEKLDQLLTKRSEFIRSRGGYWEMNEFDQGINDINREIIAVFYELYPDAWVGNVNQYENNNQPIMKKYSGEFIHNFEWDFIIDKYSIDLTDRIIAYNKAKTMQEADILLTHVYSMLPKRNSITFTWE